MMSSKVVLRTVVGLAVAAAPIILGVGSASASATECVNYNISDDTSRTNVCTYVNGSGTYVNYVNVEISDTDQAPATDDWFPTIGGCEVSVGWQNWDHSGNSPYNDWTSDLSCSSVKNAGGHSFSVYENVAAGTICGDLNFVTFNQFIGNDGCVTIDS